LRIHDLIPTLNGLQELQTKNPEPGTQEPT
jgi:hypothetical protein